METKRKKTWGREVAVVIMLWFAYIVETKDIEYAQILILPVSTIVIGTFGLKRLTADTGMFSGGSVESPDRRGAERLDDYEEMYKMRRDEGPRYVSDPKESCEERRDTYP